MKKMDKNTKLKDVLKIKGGSEVLAKYHMPCLTCPMAAMEIEKLKLGQISEMYGLDIKNMLKELNSLKK